MTFFSKNTLQNKAVLLIAGVALTTMASAYNSQQSSPSHSKQATKLVTYTASGKTDVRTARLFQQLMKNNPNIQVTAKVSNKAKKPSAYVDVNYTIKGKTNRATVRKLVRLFQTSKRVEVITNIHQKSAASGRYSNKQYIPNNYYSYQGYAIQPVTNPTIWYRVPVWTQPYPSAPKMDITQAPFPMDYSQSVAGK